MNAKKILCMVVALAMAVPVFGRKIHWNDKWDTKKKSIEILVPIDGNIDEETGEVTLNFLQDLGYVNITIADVEGNILYAEGIEALGSLNWAIVLDKEHIRKYVISVSNEVYEVYGYINF